MGLQSRWLIRVAALAGAGVLRAWLGTVRKRVMSADGRTHPPDPDVERFIYAFWHESLLAPVKIRTRATVLVSQSADGELIAQVCRHLGVGVVRGSATRGGACGLLDLVREGRRAHLAITPDGPRGPRRHLKPGIIFAASHTGLPIVPVGVGFTRAWRAGSWDRFALPRPGSTMTGILGKPIVVPPELDVDALERCRLQVENALLEATQAAEQWAEQIAWRSSRKSVLPDPAKRDDGSANDPGFGPHHPALRPDSAHTPSATP